jgi:hypothetical protein
VNKKRKKASVNKSKENVEFCLGDAGPTKYKIMKAIAKKYSIYEATVWLNEPLEDLGGKTPAEFMLQGKLEEVAALMKKSDGELGL